ncbi:MAG: peroxidase-related enzyme [Terracidiphilus sp.]
MNLPEYELISRTASRPKPPQPKNLGCVEEDKASNEVAELYQQFRSRIGRPDVPGILKCFATHPSLLRNMMDLSESLIFCDGHLSRRQKEMIATLISSENACAYCADSHGYFLRMHGGTVDALCAIQRGQLDSSCLSPSERALLAFVRKINSHSHEIVRADIDILVRCGWSQLQIAEAVHVAALFASFNRVANTFGLLSQGLLDLIAHEPANPGNQA